MKDFLIYIDGTSRHVDTEIMMSSQKWDEERKCYKASYKGKNFEWHGNTWLEVRN